MDAQRRHHAHPKSGEHGGAPAVPADQGAADPEVLRLISEVQSQLEGLKRVHAEREQTKAGLDQRQTELDTLAQEHKQQSEALASRERAAHAADAQAKQRQAEFETLAAELTKVEQESKQRTALAAEERQAVEAIAADLGAREKSLGERSARFDQLQLDLRALKHRLAETERTAAERAEELLRSHDEAADLARRLQNLEQQAPAAERQAAAARAEMAKAAEAAERAGAELASRQQAITELTERCRTLEGRLAEQDSLHAEQDQSVNELRRRLDEAALAADGAGEQRDSAREELAGERRRGAELQARLEAAGRDLQQVGSERDQSTVALATAQAQAQKLVRQQQMTADAQARLAAAAKELRQTVTARDESAAALAGASAQARELTSQVATLQEQAESLRRQAAARASRADAGLTLRRRRMQRCRVLLRERAGKIRQAGEMLRARHQQYEQVLSMRGEVITAKRAVDTLQKRVQSASARTHAASALFYLAGLITILGALSWAITRQVVPATYTARAVVVPEARNRTLSEAELADWQSYHETLLGDPQFLETAAERMGRRGITTLATAGDLRAELEKSFDYQSAQDGQLVLELRGLGDERTQRVLDTYVTALVSQANAAREHRTDGAATTIREPAKCAATPIEDPRPLYAAGILGGSTVVSLLIGGLIWGRLAAAKQKYETEARIDEFVESPDWPPAKATV